ncbi:hypothetical protein EYF80_004785 [Liparis tanakae]|uniref:Uncharacterized protein n=1 Tax=Liparis tanakae TaxID=230148 RepID=A0A4Z2J3F2_9TELE|nr:hypothetical protein EYF80_004785 [Liparis tanakae]
MSPVLDIGNRYLEGIEKTQSQDAVLVGKRSDWNRRQKQHTSNGRAEQAEKHRLLRLFLLLLLTPARGGPSD